MLIQVYLFIFFFLPSFFLLLEISSLCRWGNSVSVSLPPIRQDGTSRVPPRASSVCGRREGMGPDRIWRLNYEKRSGVEIFLFEIKMKKVQRIRNKKRTMFQQEEERGHRVLQTQKRLNRTFNRFVDLHFKVANAILLLCPCHLGFFDENLLNMREPRAMISIFNAIFVWE